MSNQADFPQPYGLPPEDEISISELLMKLWAKRGLIVMLPLVLAGLTMVGLLASKTAQQTTVSYYIELSGIYLGDTPGSDTDTESDRDKDKDKDSDVTTRYPNGTLFSPQDLLNPAVLKSLGEEFGLDPLDLADHLDVQYGTPVSNGVLAEYRAALAANAKASAEDLAAINARFKAKLDAASKRGVKITVDFVELDLEKSQGLNIAVRLPKLWNTIFTSQFNTTLNPSIMGIRWTAALDLNTTTGLQEADIQLAQLKLGTELISKDGRLRGIVNEKGVSASDLLGYIDNFRTIFFEPLYLEAFETDTTLNRIYEQDLTLQITKVTDEITELNARLGDIRDFQSSSRGTGGTGQSGRESASLDGSALSEVVSLAERAALSNYLQSSLDQRYELTKELTELKAKLQRITRATGAAEDSAITPEFVEMGTERYGNIIAGYRDLVTKAQSITKARTPEFYAVMTQPEVDGQLIEKRDLLFIALALALGGMLAIVAALVWPSRDA